MTPRPDPDGVAVLDDIILSWAELAKRIFFEGNVISPRQARFALAQSNLLDAVDAFVQAGDAALKIEWEYATEIRRGWPPVAAFATANNIDDATIDGLFELAMTL